MLAVGFEVDELAADFEIDLLADVDELDWQLTPTVTPRSTAHRQLFSIRQVLALLQPVIAEGEMTWARLIGCVRLVGADPYSVARIAAELADADVGVLTESPRQRGVGVVHCERTRMASANESHARRSLGCGKSR